MPTEHQRSLADAFKNKIHSCLAGRCSFHHQDHSFSFEREHDDWEIILRHRSHKSLQAYKEKWNSLKIGTTLGENTFLPFLGHAFGGTLASQISHIKHLILESFEGWPSFWTLHLGQKTTEQFKKFLDMEAPDMLTCHEYFNILEHRATLNYLADIVVRYFALPTPDNIRCRDWDHQEWQTKLSPAQQKSLLQSYQVFCATIPAANIPPGVNPNKYSPIQTRLDIPAFYMNASLSDRFASAPQQIQRAAIRVKDFLKAIEVQQVKVLVENSELRAMCADWLHSIHIPVRQLDNTYIPEFWRDFSGREIVPPIDDECEYEVLIANVLSQSEVVDGLKETHNGYSGGGSIQHNPTTPRLMLNPGVLAQTHIVIPGHVEHDLGTFMPRNFPDKVKEYLKKEENLFKTLTVATDDTARQKTIDELYRLRAQFKELEQTMKGAKNHQESNAKAPSLTERSIQDASISSTTATLEQKEETGWYLRQEEKPALKGDRQAEDRHPRSAQTVPHEVQKSTTGTQKNDPRGSLTTVNADQEQARDRGTEESNRETTTPEVPPSSRTQHANMNIHW